MHYNMMDVPTIFILFCIKMCLFLFIYKRLLHPSPCMGSTLQDELPPPMFVTFHRPSVESLQPTFSNNHLFLLSGETHGCSRQVTDPRSQGWNKHQEFQLVGLIFHFCNRNKLKTHKS